MIQPLLKKTSLDPTILDSFCPLSSIPSGDKVIEQVVEKADYLNPARLVWLLAENGTEVALALEADLHWGLDREVHPC